MTEIISKIQNWEYLMKMPDKKLGFTKILFDSFESVDGIVRLFSLSNEKTYCSVEGLYDDKTSDFMLHCCMGFHRFHDIRFISKELDEYEKKIDELMDSLLKELDPEFINKPDFFIKRKGLEEWKPKQLEDSWGGMELYIQPPRYFHTINGAVVLLDYSDFQNLNQFSLFYNRMRDDFYAERRIEGKVEVISEFDCKTLEELDSLIADLPMFIEDIQRK